MYVAMYVCTKILCVFILLLTSAMYFDVCARMSLYINNICRISYTSSDGDPAIKITGPVLTVLIQ